MEKQARVFLLSILIAVLLILVGYFLLAFYYRQGFSLNTWINGIYCTGKSVEEVNAELLSNREAPIVIITDGDGRKHEISLADVGYTEDYLPGLQSYLDAQNPFLWIDNVTFHKKHELLPQINYDSKQLKEIFYALDPIKEDRQRLTDYTIVRDSEKGYQLYDGLSNRIDLEKAYQAVISAIENGENTVDLRLVDCYYDIPLDEEQQEVFTLWQKVEAFQNCDIVYDMGAEKIELSPNVVSEFLKTQNEIPIVDGYGQLVLESAAIEAYIADLAEEYDTYGKERRFKSTEGRVVTVKGGTYGTTLNQKAEVEYLKKNLLLPKVHTGIKQEHIPEYKREAYVRGKNDLGGTYIEVDMTAQRLYFYVDYKIQIETPVVTGNMRKGHDTPEGTNYVYSKQKNRILRGPGYASHVDYWMPVNRGIGLHDADWRDEDEFGGEIYKTNGSHGCINIPPSITPDVYELAEIGTPVVMFY